MGSPAISLIVAVARLREGEHAAERHWRRVALVVRPKR
jgi:hypothetical protein